MRKKILQTLGFSLIILLYTTFFQVMYCWMVYDKISAGVTLVDWLFSLMVNYLPILSLSFGILAVCRLTLRVKHPWGKIAIDIAASMAILVVVNILFALITGMSLNWGGSIFNGVIVLLGVEFWLLSQQKQRSLMRENLLTKENMAMQYEIQKAYVNPHFLYNTLDMLSALIEDEKRDESLAFIMRMSGYYRAMTKKLNKPVTTLSEEVDLVKNYLDIVKYRHRDALSFRIEGDADSDPTLVPFAIQLLVENALKHNRLSAQQPVNIVVSVSDAGITVSNNCNPKIDTPHKGTGLGLSYLQKIYAYHGKKIEIDDSPAMFAVRLPSLALKPAVQPQTA